MRMGLGSTFERVFERMGGLKGSVRDEWAYWLIGAKGEWIMENMSAFECQYFTSGWRP
jgi:hypothetical protein